MVHTSSCEIGRRLRTLAVGRQGRATLGAHRASSRRWPSKANLFDFTTRKPKDFQKEV
jgi:hypothetical protein